MKSFLSIPLEESESRRHIHPPFEGRLLLVIERALREAWKLLLGDRDDRHLLNNEHEPRITQRLRVRLNQLRTNGGAKGYDCDTFERPHVGTEYYNYKGEKVRKPDIVFALCGKPRPGVTDDLYDAIFVECKLIDNGKRNAGQYCDKGLMRFVDGSYSWRMPQGMMVAYVRTSQNLPKALEEGLGKYGRIEKLKLKGSLRRCTLSRSHPHVYLSEHNRDWLLPERTLPGPIQVHHLWLKTR